MVKKIFFLFSFLLFFIYPHYAFAEVIHSFDVSVVAHKDGVMDVREKIEYDFEDTFHHGIFRNIPIFSKVGDLYRNIKLDNVKVLRDGKNEKFDTTLEKEQLNIKIGDADRTIDGDHVYDISYSVQNGIGSNFSDHDEIYWNATGNDWEITIEKASINISTDFGVLPSKLICFEGTYGSKDQTCQIQDSTASSSQSLYAGYGLSAVAVYSPGTFPKSILSTTPPQTLGDQIAALFARLFKYIWLFLNIILPVYIWYWWGKHKNKKRFGDPAVNFETPKDEKGKILPPALAGTIDTARLDRDDVTATLFDLAIRKYIKIEQSKKVRTLAPDTTNQTITKLKEPDSSLFTFEKTLMDRLFRDGDSVSVDTLKTDFYSTFGIMEDQVFKALIEKGYYTKNPKTQKGLLIVGAFFALFTSNIILAIALFVLAGKLNGRTALGDEIDFKIDGLKLFLKSMDRNYKWQAEKFYTVEHMIPYAMALGYIDKFMEALKILKPDYNPSWYSGSNFYVSYALFSAAATTSFTTSAPSSSSGSGGGGFSGGGGGGGGGGSW